MKGLSAEVVVHVVEAASRDRDREMARLRRSDRCLIISVSLSLQSCDIGCCSIIDDGMLYLYKV